MIPQGHEYFFWIRGILEDMGEPHWLAEAMAAVCAHETGYGLSVPVDMHTGEESHNHFGSDRVEGKPFVTAREAMTGRMHDYRAWSSVEDCLESLRYAFHRSSHYARARHIARRGLLRAMGRVWCPMDRKWGAKVLKAIDMHDSARVS